MIIIESVVMLLNHTLWLTNKLIINYNSRQQILLIIFLGRCMIYYSF